MLFVRPTRGRCGPYRVKYIGTFLDVKKLCFNYPEVRVKECRVGKLVGKLVGRLVGR